MLYRLSYVSFSSLSKYQTNQKLERVAGIEPASSAWKAEVLPLNYTRGTLYSVVFPIVCSLLRATFFFIRMLHIYAAFAIRLLSHTLLQSRDPKLLVVGEGFEPSKA